MSTPVAPEGQSRVLGSVAQNHMKEKWSSSPKEGRSVPRKRDRSAGQTQVSTVYLGVSGTEGNVLQIHS